jgi:C-terminal processing protease CtpA/Prc
MKEPSAARLTLALLLAVSAAAETGAPGLVGIRLGVAGPDVTVLQVVPGSSAAEAGIAVRDKLVAVGERPVGPMTLAQISASLRGEPGSVVAATFQRGEAAPVEYRLTRRAPGTAAAAPVPAEPEADAPEAGAPGMVGLRLSVDGPDVKVADVVPGSPAAEAGIAPGDKLQSVDGRPVGPMTLAQIAARLRGPAGSPVSASFARGDAAPTDYRLVRRAMRSTASVAEEAPPPADSAAPEARSPRRAGRRLSREEVEAELLP